jgi:hypothetical protein
MSCDVTQQAELYEGIGQIGCGIETRASRSALTLSFNLQQPDPAFNHYSRHYPIFFH